MKKMTKKMISAIAFVLLMTLIMGMTALAAAPYQIKITRNDGAAHTFEAYQIFKAEPYGSGINATLINIEWGEGVNSTKLVSDLKTAFPAFFPNSTYTATEVANVLASSTFADNVSAFAGIAGGCLTSTVSATANTSGDVATMSVTEGGYYLIKDKDGTLANGEGAYTEFMLKIVNNVDVTAKADAPSLDKVINVGSGVNANTASIGDSVPFKITSTVPDMTGYQNYFFVVNDTLSKGLTYNEDLAISIDGYSGTVSKDVQVTTDATGTKLSIALTDFYNQYKNLAGKTIELTYSATLNQDAVVGSAGNPNTASLTFSNNPNKDTTGDRPSPEDPVGKTPDKTTKTYTTEIKLVKVDGKDDTQFLKGAKFQIVGTGLNIVVINNEIYRKSATGTYYMLKDGSFTTTEPSPENKGSEDTFEKVTVVTKDTSNTDINSIVYTDNNGEAYFKGLKPGTYTITELEAPEGYNKLTYAVEVVITGTIETDGSCTFATSSLNATVDGNSIKVQIGNNKGIHVPETGGMGTTILYLTGALMILLSVVLFITRKRVGNKEL